MQGHPTATQQSILSQNISMSRMDQSLQMEKQQMTYNSQSLVQEDDHYESMQQDLNTSGMMLTSEIPGSMMNPKMQAS